MFRSITKLGKGLAALSALVLLPTVASANGSSVAPTRLLLGAGTASSYVVITNTSPTPQRYSVAAHRWEQIPSNPLALSDTEDIVYFPGSFTLGSMQSQRVRIGTTALSGPVEKTYRIVFSELPPLQSILNPQTSGVYFTTSFNIPIYVAPVTSTSSGEVADVGVDREHLRFSVRNIGNVHLVAKSMLVTARGISGTVMSNSSSAWFVLAKSQRDFVIPIPTGSCTAIASVSITVDAGTAKFDRTVSPEHSCG